MYTVINKTTGVEIITHDMFRISAPFPGIKLNEDEQLVFIPDTLLSQITDAYECIIDVDVDGVATGITVIKTMEQYRQENPPAPPKPTPEEYLLDLDFRLCMIELGLN